MAPLRSHQTNGHVVTIIACYDSSF
jgi:hypothetical protein